MNWENKIYKMKRSIISGNRNRFSLYPYEEGDGKGERGEGWLFWGEPFFLLFWPGVGCLFQEGCTLIRACMLIWANTVQCKFIRKLIKVWSSHLEIQRKLSASYAKLCSILQVTYSRCIASNRGVWSSFWQQQHPQYLPFHKNDNKKSNLKRLSLMSIIKYTWPVVNTVNLH